MMFAVPLTDLSSAQVPALMQGVPPELATPFAQYLRETGIQLA